MSVNSTIKEQILGERANSDFAFYGGVTWIFLSRSNLQFAYRSAQKINTLRSIESNYLMRDECNYPKQYGV